MMQEPWFWRSRTPAARAIAFALAPSAAAYALGRRLKDAAIRPTASPVPVICVGNATLGGVGKTPFALTLRTLLGRSDAFFLTRGYGGRLKGPALVDLSTDDAARVGDEALLLAKAGPTVISRNRIAGAQFAAQAGARLIIMDDGLQNRTIEKTCSFLLVDAADPDGNGMTFPSGPLRESIMEAATHADALVAIGSGDRAFAAPAGLPRFRAWLEPDAPAPCRVVAFCGVGAPHRFFRTLSDAGYELASEHAFPDHHRYCAEEINLLRAEAHAAKASLITTSKDFVRLPMDMRDGVKTLAVTMRVDDPEGVIALVRDRLGGRKGATGNG
jgi:tetraacyldisaccharide 4'-kinase